VISLMFLKPAQRMPSVDSAATTFPDGDIFNLHAPKFFQRRSVDADRLLTLRLLLAFEFSGKHVDVIEVLLSELKHICGIFTGNSADTRIVRS